MTMLKDMAKAITAEAMNQNSMLEVDNDGLGFYDAYDNKVYDSVAIAKAVLTAMREPTDAVLAAGAKALYDQDDMASWLSEKAYYAMIDAILADKA